jgi:hypothetical protein
MMNKLVRGVVKDKLVREVVKEAFTPVPLEETWSVNEETPEIKQIYGTYLPAFYLIYFREYMHVTSFHANPHAHHDTNGYMRSKLLSLKIPREMIENIISRIGKAEKFILSKGVKIRKEINGAVIYTPQHNIYYLNEKGYKILGKVVNNHTSINELSLDEEKFIIKLIMAGVIEPVTT